jgi:hypothetical protein
MDISWANLSLFVWYLLIIADYTSTVQLFFHRACGYPCQMGRFGVE